MLRARDAMDRAYAEPLDLPTLARIANVSQAHFIRTFRATFGETPHRYLQRRRVERAMFLLRATDRSVTDVCLDVGFSSLGTFSRIFRDIVGGFGADLVMDCSGHPSAGPEGIEMLRDGGTYVEMGQFTDAGSIQTSWHRICTKDLNVLGSWGFTGNDLPLGVDMLYRTRAKYPWLEMQTLYPFSEEGIGRAVADAMAMKTVKSTIVPWPELAE